MKVIDLFAGCGGMSLGFQNAGFEVISAYDNWQSAVDVYSHNFDHPIKLLDLSQLEDYTEFKQHHADIIIGGPPCQDFSSAGKRDETLGRADLTITFANIIHDVRPQWVVMENVDRIRKSFVLKQAKSIYNLQVIHSMKLL